jgi:hypothetical protein
MTEPNLTWGDFVRVASAAPENLRPGEVGDVVGFRGHPDQAGEILYTVEYGDGSSAEVPGQFLVFLEHADAAGRDE